MKACSLEINISKSILEEGCLELPDWHVREPQHRGGPRADLACAICAAFVPAQSSLIFLLWHIKEKHRQQTCASQAEPTFKHSPVHPAQEGMEKPLASSPLAALHQTGQARI